MDIPEQPSKAEVEEAKAIIGRLFRAAAQRAGGAQALSARLGLEAAALRPYLAGEAIPPAELLLRSVELVLDQLDSIARGASDGAWQLLVNHYQNGQQR